jgi:hypothetical protein
MAVIDLGRRSKKVTLTVGREMSNSLWLFVVCKDDEHKVCLRIRMSRKEASDLNARLRGMIQTMPKRKKRASTPS